MRGTERAMIAQERRAQNNVAVFEMKKSSHYSFYAEIVSQVDTRPMRTLKVFLTTRGRGPTDDQTVLVAIPNISETIPIFVLFRALGLESSEDIEEYCTHDRSDVVP